MTGRHERRCPAGWGTRRGVAVAVFGTDNPKVAVARLGRWIASDSLLRRELSRRGYRSRQREFPPAVMRVFRNFGL